MLEEGQHVITLIKHDIARFLFVMSQ